MTIGEIDLIASALGLVPWQVMREAQEAVGSGTVPAGLKVADGDGARSDGETARPDDDLPDFSLFAARKFTSRPSWDASRVSDDVGEEPQE